MAQTHAFDGVAEIEQALSDPRLIPFPAEGGPAGSMAWLRNTVARFASGAVHAPRRALVEAELARVEPAALRALAAAGDGDDRRVVVLALAEGLGLDVGEDADAFAAAVFTVADNYFGIADAAAADAAVKFLLPRMTMAGGRESEDPESAAWLELAANRIGLLVQACDATTTLIGRARDAAAGEPAEAVAATLVADPPVAAMRRLAAEDTVVGGTGIAAGDLVVLNVGPVGLTFGAGPRVCPGRAHAVAVAEGALARETE